MKRSIIACVIPALMSGCYVVPISSQQVDKLEQLLEQAQNAQYPKVASAAPQAVPAASSATAKEVPAITIPAGPTTLYARLYPMNDVATENGMVSGTVTSLMNGKGRFQVVYRGEPLTGEATRVSGEDRKGVASAWGANGTFMSCEYQMSSLLRGAGTCNFSDGAKYQVHVGN